MWLEFGEVDQLEKELCALDCLAHHDRHLHVVHHKGKNLSTAHYLL